MSTAAPYPDTAAGRARAAAERALARCNRLKGQRPAQASEAELFAWTMRVDIAQVRWLTAVQKLIDEAIAARTGQVAE